MRHSITKDPKKFIKKAVILLIWIGIWQIAGMIVGQELFLPYPFPVMERLFQMSMERDFWVVILHTVGRVSAGVLLSLFAAGITVVLCSKSSLIKEFFQPFFHVIRATPVMSLIILAIVWFTSGRVPVFIGFLICFPILWTNL